MYSVKQPLGVLHLHWTIILKTNLHTFLNNAHNKFYKNVANSLVADTRSQPDGSDLRICRSSCLIRSDPTQNIILSLGPCGSIPQLTVGS